MPVTASPITPSIKVSRHALVERIIYEAHNLEILLRLLPENTTWRIEFSEVVAHQVLDERDLLKYWPQCSGQAISQIHTGGWLSDLQKTSSHFSFEFYDQVTEYLIASDQTCLCVISKAAPTLQELG